MVLTNKIAQSAVRRAIDKRTGGNGLIGMGLGLVATRIATGSIPGALLVGGVFVAKKIYDQRKAQKAGGGDGHKSKK